MFGNDPSISTLKKHLWSIDYNLFFFWKTAKILLWIHLDIFKSEGWVCLCCWSYFWFNQYFGGLNKFIHFFSILQLNRVQAFNNYNILYFFDVYCNASLLISIFILHYILFFIYIIVFIEKIYIIFWSQFLLPQLLPDPSHLTTHPVPYSLFLCVCRKQTNIFPQINLVFFFKKEKAWETHTKYKTGKIQVKLKKCPKE